MFESNIVQKFPNLNFNPDVISGSTLILSLLHPFTDLPSVTNQFNSAAERRKSLTWYWTRLWIVY